MERQRMERQLIRKTGRSRGYTIVEVLVAVVILAIALPGLVAMVVGGRKSQVASLRMDQASSIGSQVLDSISLRPGDLAVSTASNNKPTVVLGGTTYTAEVVVTRVDLVTLATVTVRWKQGSNDHSVVTSGVLR